MDKPFKDEELVNICAAIGYITISWALMERQLDNCMHLIHVDLGGVPKFPLKPQGFKNKLKYLRQAFGNIQELAVYKKDTLILLDKAEELSIIRHNITHGAVDGFEGKTLSINKLKIGEDYVPELHKFDFNDFTDLAENLGDVVKKCTALAESILIDKRRRKS